MRKALVVVAVVAAGLEHLLGSSTSQTPALAELLKRVGVYHAEYASKVSGVSLEEQYLLTNVSGGQIRSNVRLASDVVLVRANGNVAALRDVFAVDTRPTRERTPRITSLLTAPEATMRDWETASRFPQAGALHFLLDIIVKVNEPTMALRFVALSAQTGLKYKLDGRKKLNGVETLGIGFEEPIGRDKKYLLGTRRNGRASGRIWVEPATGAVHQTELWVESKGESASTAVKYAPNLALGLILPTETTETFEEREFSGKVRDFQSADPEVSSRYSFQASAKYSKATYTPIDLAKLKK